MHVSCCYTLIKREASWSSVILSLTISRYLDLQESEIEPRRSTIKLPVRVKVIPTPPRRFVMLFAHSVNKIGNFALACLLLCSHNQWIACRADSKSYPL